MEKTEKILSVCVAGYNMEKYISKTLDSCMKSSVVDKLDVIIVNDGSTDSTPEIAESFVREAPGSFRLINKENGGYGSTVNAGIRAAQGKYFRLLDGDDWFDTDGLEEFVGILENSCEDMVISRFRRVFENDGHTEERDEGDSVPFVTGRFDGIPDGAWFTMHAITYRTALLRELDITLTENCYYTDQEYDLLPLRGVETVRVAPVTLYCYRIGHGEQSVSLSGLEKHYREQVTVLKKLYGVYPEVHKKLSVKDRYIYSYFVKRTRFQIRTFLIISQSKEHKRELVGFVNYLKTEQPDIFRDLLRQSNMVKLLIRSGFTAYGLLHGIMLKKYRY